MPIFVISDTHFNHGNIITFCGRPFKSIDHMNQVMVDNWNSVVGPDDLVIHLGDFGFSYKYLGSIVEKLNGRKQLVRGNHDYSIANMNALGFQCLNGSRNEFVVRVENDTRLVMAHRPSDLPTWKPDCLTLDDYPIVLCGHEHNNAPFFIKWVRMPNDEARPIMALNMSCEYWDYKPTPLEEVITRYRAILAEFVK